MLPAPTVTGWSTFWSLSAPPGQGSAYSLYGNRTQFEGEVSRYLGKRGFKQSRRLMYTLLGAATGQAASETEKRVQGQIGSANYIPPAPSKFGGAIDIETVTIVSRNTTAADLTYAQALFNRTYDLAPAIASYPVDASGNGGGGKVGV